MRNGFKNFVGDATRLGFSARDGLNAAVKLTQRTRDKRRRFKDSPDDDNEAEANAAESEKNAPVEDPKTPTNTLGPDRETSSGNPIVPTGDPTSAGSRVDYDNGTHVGTNPVSWSGPKNWVK